MNNEEDKIGIACPKCGCRELRVITTRKSQTCILRYRRCRYCGYHLTTRERVIGQNNTISSTGANQAVGLHLHLREKTDKIERMKSEYLSDD